MSARSSMDRASDYGSEGWGFDSLRARGSGESYQGYLGFIAGRGLPGRRLADC